MDARDDAFQVRKAFGDLRELGLEGCVIEQVLDCVEPRGCRVVRLCTINTTLQTYLALISATSRRGMQSQIRNSRLPERQDEQASMNRTVATYLTA